MGFVPFDGSAKSLPVAVTTAPDAAIDTSIIGSGCDKILGMAVWAFVCLIIGCAALVGVGIWAIIAFCYSLKGSVRKTKKLDTSSVSNEDVLDMLVKRLQSANESTQQSTKTEDNNPIQLVVLQ